MNHSDLTVLLRELDPARDELAGSDLRARVLANAAAPLRQTAATRRRGLRVAVAVFGLAMVLLVLPVLISRPTQPPASPISSVGGATFLARYGDGLGGIRGAALDGERIWVMSPFEQTLFEIPLDGGDVVEHPIGFYAEGVRLLDGAIWLEGWDPNQLIRFVPARGLFGSDELTRIPLPDAMRDFGIVAGEQIWNTAGGALVRVAADGSVLAVDDQAGLGPLTLGFGSVWAGGVDGSLQELDPSDGAVLRRFDLDGVEVGGIVAGPSTLFVMDRTTNSVASVRPDTGEVAATVDIGGRPRSMAIVDNSLWVSTFESTLVEIDAGSGELLRTVAMRGAPGFLFPVGDRLGVSLFRSAQIAVIDPTRPLLDLPPGEVNDQVIDVSDGRAVRLRCLGSGPTTVLLEATMGEGVEAWADIQAMLGSSYRVCASERSGLWSVDDRPFALSSDDAARDLRQALDAGGERGPFLLVGDGVGGWVSRAFAAAFPDEVRGMVLVDPQPDDFLERFAELAPAETVREATAGFLAGNENTRLRNTTQAPAGLAVVIVGRDGFEGDFAFIGDRAIIADLEAAWFDGQQALADLLDARVVTVERVRYLVYDAPEEIAGAVAAVDPDRP